MPCKLKMKYIRTISLIVRLCRTVTRPDITYAAESWTLTDKMEKALAMWRRKILKKNMGHHMKMVQKRQDIPNKFGSSVIVTVRN